MLSQLREIVEHVSRVEDVSTALDILVKETCSAMQTECCTVYLANNDMQRLELMATQGLISKAIAFTLVLTKVWLALLKEVLNLSTLHKHLLTLLISFFQSLEKTSITLFSVLRLSTASKYSVYWSFNRRLRVYSVRWKNLSLSRSQHNLPLLWRTPKLKVIGC